MPFSPFESLIPRSAIRGLQNAMAPGSDQENPMGLGSLPDALGDIAGNVLDHPMETLGGFASGALEAGRQQFSPVGIAGMLAGPVLGGLAKAAPLADDAVRMVDGGFDLVNSLPIEQISPSMDDVGALAGDLQ